MAKYNITSAGQLIDITTITNGCNQIETAAQKFEECAKKVVDKTTMQPQLDADAEYIQSIKTAIINFTLQIKNVALQIYAEQQSELADYQAAQAAKNNGNTTP